MIGFSAGGHLAATVSNFNLAGDPAAADAVARVSSRPDFSILCYSVIAFGNKEYTHKGSQHALLGKRPAPELVASLSAENAVTSETPPTFLMHTEADQLVPAENSRVHSPRGYAVDGSRRRRGCDVDIPWRRVRRGGRDAEIRSRPARASGTTTDPRSTRSAGDRSSI